MNILLISPTNSGIKDDILSNTNNLFNTMESSLIAKNHHIICNDLIVSKKLLIIQQG